MRAPPRFLRVCQAVIISGEKICGAPALHGVELCQPHLDEELARGRRWDEAATAAAEAPRGEDAGEQLGLFGGGA